MKNILIVGMGEVGSHLAKVLSKERHAVTVIDPDKKKLSWVADAYDVRTVLGDGSRPNVLDEADVHSADLLLAVSNDDSVNMLCCLFGKRMGAKTTVLRLKDTSPVKGNTVIYRKNLLFDLMLSLEDLAAEEIVKTIRQNQAVGVENFADGKIQMRRLRVPEGSSLSGVPLKDLKIPEGVLLVALVREHGVIIPSGDTVIEGNDMVFVLGEPKPISAFEKRTGARPTYLRDVIISGASGIVVKVCRALRRLHVATRVIVEDRQDAERMSEILEGAVVLHGNSTDLNLLQEERVGDVDAFLGLSDEDEKNLMSCQLAKSLNVKRTVALVQKPDYAMIYEQLGIDCAISPRLICADRIHSFVRSESVSTIATIEDGQAEILEFEVKPGGKLVGKTLATAGFPRGCVVGAIARENGDILVPRGESEIHALDNLVCFVLKDVVAKVMALFGIKKE
jgi:trk system potassium uptake protein TrkA